MINWCNFTDRLRQSVREAAYLRMIFAQQFMVNALGLHISGNALIGTDSFVQQEVAKLRAAKYQYQLAEQGLSEALDQTLGSGCYVSDFYQQPEWALFSRAAEGQELAQHHIAVRLSYLDIKTTADIPAVRANAQAVYRAASVEGYVKLIGMASPAANTAGCAKGERPDSNLVASMALTMLDTRSKAHELLAGRNIFGFDIAFTPALPYHTAFGSTDKGLWEQAKEAADQAANFQKQAENTERNFDLN